VRQPPEDIGRVAARASSNRRRPEPLPANLVHRPAYCLLGSSETGEEGRRLQVRRICQAKAL
jgi:hypothetical protein